MIDVRILPFMSSMTNLKGLRSIESLLCPLSRVREVIWKPSDLRDLPRETFGRFEVEGVVLPKRGCVFDRKLTGKSTEARER